MWRKKTTSVLALAILALAGCAKTEREVSQSIMPAALNYYVLTQEISRLRAKVGSLPSEKLGEVLPTYRDIISRGQQMHLDLGQMKDVRSHQDLLAAMDSSLTTQLQFLQLEIQAVGALAENRLANIEIERIEQQTRGNTLARARHQAELDQLSDQAHRSYALLESLKPQLGVLTQKNLGQMRIYNQMVLERKILTYTAPEGLLALLPWEKPAAPAKAVPKNKPSTKATASQTKPR